MLAYISGKVVAKLAGKVIVKVPSGLGYLISISPNQNYLENENLELFLLEINTIEAINQSDTDILTEVPGLGAKTAKKIVIEFKGAKTNIKKFEAAEVNLTNDFTIDFVDTLSGLGYRRGEIVSIITRLKRQKAWDESNLIETVKKGLEELGRGK